MTDLKETGNLAGSKGYPDPKRATWVRESDGTTVASCACLRLTCGEVARPCASFTRKRHILGSPDTAGSPVDKPQATMFKNARAG